MEIRESLCWRPWTTLDNARATYYATKLMMFFRRQQRHGRPAHGDTYYTLLGEATE